MARNLLDRESNESHVGMILISVRPYVQVGVTRELEVNEARWQENYSVLAVGTVGLPDMSL